MINKPIWIVSCKAHPSEGCSIKFDNSEFYFVEPRRLGSNAQHLYLAYKASYYLG